MVIQVQALTGGRIEGGTGRGVHGFWLHHWRTVDAGMADALHRGDGVVPFTLSPLMGLSRPNKGVVDVAGGDQAWMRLATLSRSLSEATLEKWAPRIPAEIQIADIPWRVDQVILNRVNHPWAGQISYHELAGAHLYTIHPPRKWRLQFLTPVAFRSANGHFPFPLPNSLVASWLRRWQAYSPVALPEDLPDRARDQVIVSAYELKTIPVRHGERLTVGCVGHLEIAALDLHPAERAALDALAAFAFFAGSGHRTTQGMGMTRLVQAPSRMS
jgi:CRISPR-associated endoribonuclease Cas6